jgi:hypothetical protein
VPRLLYWPSPPSSAVCETLLFLRPSCTAGLRLQNLLAKTESLPAFHRPAQPKYDRMEVCPDPTGGTRQGTGFSIVVVKLHRKPYIIYRIISIVRGFQQCCLLTSCFFFCKVTQNNIAGKSCFYCRRNKVEIVLTVVPGQQGIWLCQLSLYRSSINAYRSLSLAGWNVQILVS